ncbi:MAG: methyltransferase domain-containing protein [Candidatus Brocadiae bacterium]|nr:methyltransferase domain-containing protein [Candidatus Brocadiia bacterium]
MGDLENLTERQAREVEYHKEFAKQVAEQSPEVNFYDVVSSPRRRWWNGYWAMYSYLRNCPLQGKRVLIVGCGFGKDALRIARLGAEVYAFDISLESLNLAKESAKQQSLKIDFQMMTAEKLLYDSDFFDYILCNDILHHIDISVSMKEIKRVAKKDAIFMANEIYSHSITNAIRHSSIVEKKLYPMMQAFVYQSKKPYITKDEKKMSEKDILQVSEQLKKILLKKYYNFLVTRIFPDKFHFLNMLDKVLLTMLYPFQSYLAGRIFLVGTIEKQ